MELKPTNQINKTEQALPKKVDDFGQPENTKIDETHLGEVTPSGSSQSHYRADTDSNQQALHHTLGPGRNQSAPGNHIHDGTSSPKLGTKKFNTTVGHEGEIINALSISGAKAGNAALASVIALLKNVIDFDDNTTA